MQEQETVRFEWSSVSVQWTVTCNNTVTKYHGIFTAADTSWFNGESGTERELRINFSFSFFFREVEDYIGEWLSFPHPFQRGPFAHSSTAKSKHVHDEVPWTSRLPWTKDRKMKQFIAKYNEIIVSMDTTWLPLSENTPLVQLSTIGWPRRSLWSYRLSDDDTF